VRHGPGSKDPGPISTLKSPGVGRPGFFNVCVTLNVKNDGCEPCIKAELTPVDFNVKIRLYLAHNLNDK
jgi:hypothetical protein